jgi:hypothetical protein
MEIVQAEGGRSVGREVDISARRRVTEEAEAGEVIRKRSRVRTGEPYAFRAPRVRSAFISTSRSSAHHLREISPSPERPLINH